MTFNLLGTHQTYRFGHPLSVVRQLWKATAIPFQPGMGAFHPQPMMAMATNGAMPMMGVYGGEEYLGIEVGEIRGETPPKNDWSMIYDGRILIAQMLVVS